MLTEYDTIDQILGDAATRYFGDGHRRVAYDIVSEHVAYTATCAARLSGVWSQKSGVNLPPHASTIDAILLAASASQRYCREVLHWSKKDADALIPVTASIRAGSQPTPVQNIPVRVWLTRSPEDMDPVGMITFAATVGNMEVDLGLVRLTTPAGAEPLDHPTDGVFPSIFATRRGTIRDITVADRTTIEATVGINWCDDPAPGNNLAAWGADRVQLVELVPILGQLAQVLVYEHDGISRAEAENLWMRRIDLSLALDSPLQVGSACPMVGCIASSRDVRVGPTTFRTFHVSAQTPFFTCQADIAHILVSACDVSLLPVKVAA